MTVRARDLLIKNFGAFFTQNLWWISSTYNDRFLVLLPPQQNTTTHKYELCTTLLHERLNNTVGVENIDDETFIYRAFVLRRFFKLLRSTGIDSKESIPPAYLA